jgi:hypothetical protein
MNGYILIARKILDGQIWDKPPLYLKLWIWMLMQARFKDTGNLKRGQFFTTIDEMRRVMNYKIGYRKVVPTRKEIRGAYESLTKGHTKGTTKGPMISVTKGTRGMVITILNYEKYQNIKNYERHTENNHEGHTEGHYREHTKKERKKKKRRNIKIFSSDSIEIRLSEKLFSLIQHRNPENKKPNFQTWAKHIDRMIRLEGRKPEKIETVIEWCQQDDFWQNNILSTEKLRKQFDQLLLKMPETTPKNEKLLAGAI